MSTRGGQLTSRPCWLSKQIAVDGDRKLKWIACVVHTLSALRNHVRARASLIGLMTQLAFSCLVSLVATNSFAGRRSAIFAICMRRGDAGSHPASMFFLSHLLVSTYDYWSGGGGNRTRGVDQPNAFGDNYLRIDDQPAEAPGHRGSFAAGLSLTQSDKASTAGDLHKLVAAWPRLPENVKAAILLVAGTCASHRSGD